MVRQVIVLGDLVGRIERLEVRCTRCPRQGCVRLAKLLAEHGAELGLPDLAMRLAADCPRAQVTNVAERCFVIFPLSGGSGQLCLDRSPPLLQGFHLRFRRADNLLRHGR